MPTDPLQERREQAPEQSAQDLERQELAQEQHRQIQERPGLGQEPHGQAQDRSAPQKEWQGGSAYYSALTEPTVVHPPVRPQPAPPPAIQHIVPTRPAPDSRAAQGAAGAPYRKRGVALYAAIAASLAAVIAVVALVFVLANRDDGRGNDNVPTLGGPPPTDVRLTDSGSTIGVTWTDPADGKTTFLITMAHPGEVLKPVTQVGPGQTSYRMTGLSTKLDYCFVVVAVYGTNTFAKSPLTCTSRSGTR
jgi:hypothetical protein